MLLKRVAQHLARRDRAAIFIGFLIVVGGVYAAFELDRWRELESDRRANERFVELLRVELTEKLPAARNRIERDLKTEATQNAVIRWLPAAAPPAVFSAEMCKEVFRSTLLDWSSTRLETPAVLGTGPFVHSADDIELRRLLFALDA